MRRFRGISARVVDFVPFVFFVFDVVNFGDYAFMGEKYLLGEV